ncbi:hypothetical protein C8J57DRAFT_1551895 [Mycena rebaudengoi]|nr:hypothetical protein C8J57DRAFT_1551895 [Mycena rebaudengoi]
MASSRKAATKFYQQDIVRRSSTPTTSPPAPNGIVMRCWHDAEDVAPQTPFTDPLMRPLNQGEVGVSFYGETVDRKILPESELVLVDRVFHPGDFCKRSIDDLRSGVVLNARVNGRVEHVVSGDRLDRWVTLDELADRTYAEVGDYVAYDDWIGQLYDEVLVEVSTGELVRLPELGSRLSVGEKGQDILPPITSSVHNLFGFLLGSARPSGSDTVVQITHTVYAITWLAVNQSLDPNEAQTRKRPQQYWTADNMSKLKLIRGLSDLRNAHESKVPGTTHGPDNDKKVVVKTFSVTETQTILDVLWQDGIKETLLSKELIPYLNPDEYDCWPGDYVIWSKEEDERRAVIIQSVNAADRIASVLIPETGDIVLASVLELDPHGTSDTSTTGGDMSDGLGVRRGHFLFVHPEGSTNGSPVVPRVPRIGEVEAWVRDAPFVDGQLSGFRKEMSELGASIARRRVAENIVEGQILRPVADDESLEWIGEVTAINLDGTVELTHPNGVVRSYPLQRLTKLYDGIDQLEDDMWDEMSDGHASYAEDNSGWVMGEDGNWQPEVGEEGEAEGWEDDDGSDESGESWEEGDDTPLKTAVWPDDQEVPPVDPIVSMDASIGEARADTPRPEARELLPHQFHWNSSDLEDPDSDDSQEQPWKRFEILSSAPQDHAYYNSPPAQPSKSFLGRLTREYRVLANSLPDSILVRAYEDRTDLLRSLIIGPENTPYEDAPFVIDWMLDSNFPHSPPMAHFLSWTNGNGRVCLQYKHRNLYEEGKVCLSILGTWAGDRNEIWSAGRSSLLQAFVSIQGLVLVKEPWFCEPAYEKLRGTEEGIVNSRLYNEKAYVLSRGFVRRALELPPCGRLDKVVNDAQLLIEKSKRANDADAESEAETEADRERAVPRLSAGGIITLDRTLARLIKLQRPTSS